MKHHPLAHVLARKPLGRCLDRTHRLAKGDRHIVPIVHMIDGLSILLRLKDGITIGVEGKQDEWGEPNFPEVEGEGDFDEDEFWQDAEGFSIEDEFGL